MDASRHAPVAKNDVRNGARIGEHRHDDLAPGDDGFCGFTGRGAGREQRGQRLRPPRPDRDLVATAQDIARHRRAHRPEADESNRRRHSGECSPARPIYLRGERVVGSHAETREHAGPHALPPFERSCPG